MPDVLTEIEQVKQCQAPTLEKLNIAFYMYQINCNEEIIIVFNDKCIKT